VCKTGKGNPYLKGALGEAAAAAAKTSTFLGERYRRIVKRRGKLKGLFGNASAPVVGDFACRRCPATAARPWTADALCVRGMYCGGY
jgi:hypothetical protein